MTRKLLEDTLAKQGLKAFSARGTAVRPAPARGHGPRGAGGLPGRTSVSTEVLRGFTLHDRLVRPALVMVARPPAPAPARRPPRAAVAERGTGVA